MSVYVITKNNIDEDNFETFVEAHHKQSTAIESVIEDIETSINLGVFENAEVNHTKSDKGFPLIQAKSKDNGYVYEEFEIQEIEPI